MRKLLSIAVVLATAATAANAYVTTEFVKIAEVNIEATDYRAWELRVTCTTDWTTAWLGIWLASGHMFNVASPLNFHLEQTEAMKASVANLQWDTWLTSPAGGGAPIVTGMTIQEPTVLAGPWANTDTTDIGTFSIAQITLSADAQGTVEGTVRDKETNRIGVDVGVTEDGVEGQWFIENGRFVWIPEPATLCLLAMGAVVLVRRRR